MNLSASDVSLAVSDPFGLWHNHHGDQQLKDRTDAYDLFLKEQGLRFEKKLLSKRHLSFVNLKEDEFSSAVEQTAQLLQRSGSTIYGGAFQSGRIRVKSWPLLFDYLFARSSAVSRPLRIDYPHAYYHVTSRGNERRAIFKDDQDRSVFLEKLQSSLAIYGVRLHCYVLMDNHFHLVVETPKANLSQFMRHFNVSYTAFYNRRHRRVGHLYQGRFKAILVEADSYLLELSRYVHLNPVRVGAMGHKESRGRLKYLERYRWSSLDGYLGYGKRRHWVVYDEVLSYVGGSRSRYAQFVEEGLRWGYSTPWEELKGQVILGQEGFWERVKGKWLRSEGAMKDKERPSLSMLEKIGPEEVLRKVAGYFKLKSHEITKKRSGYRDQRGLVMEVMYRLCGLKQREIGKELGGIGYTQVSHERSRIREKMERDSKVRRWNREVESLLIAKAKI